jgi:hypothetical protein
LTAVGIPSAIDTSGSPEAAAVNLEKLSVSFGAGDLRRDVSRLLSHDAELKMKNQYEAKLLGWLSPALSDAFQPRVF